MVPHGHSMENSCYVHRPWLFTERATSRAINYIILHDGPSYWIQSHTHWQWPHCPNLPPTDFLMELQQQSFYWEWHWEILIIGNLQDLINSIKAREGYSVSDGSFQTGRGAATWLIKGCNKTNHLIGTCHSLSTTDGHSSFWSKLASICVKQCPISPLHFLFNQMLPLYIQSTFASKFFLYYLWQSWLHSKKVI